MNRFERLLKSLREKIASVQKLCADIPTGEALSAQSNLENVVEILRDPKGAMYGRTAGFVAARAELAIIDLRRDERRFLLTYGTIDGMRQRIGALHPETKLRPGVSDCITMFDTCRHDSKTTTFVLRESYTTLVAIMERAEAESRNISSTKTTEKVRATLANGVVGSIQPTRKGRSATKRLIDAERRSRMRGSTNGGGKNNRRHSA